MKELRWLREEPKSHVFFVFFSFFIYHAFIVLRYKKLRAALAMERTKPINQNKKKKKPLFSSSAVAESTPGPKPFARSSLLDKYKWKK